MTDTTLVTAPAPTDRGPELVHLVCCVDPDRAYCGTARDGRPFTTRDATCIVCIDLLENADHCPVTGRRCPRDPQP